MAPSANGIDHSHPSRAQAAAGDDTRTLSQVRLLWLAGGLFPARLRHRDAVELGLQSQAAAGVAVLAAVTSALRGVATPRPSAVRA